MTTTRRLITSLLTHGQTKQGREERRGAPKGELIRAGMLAAWQRRRAAVERWQAAKRRYDRACRAEKAAEGAARRCRERSLAALADWLELDGRPAAARILRGQV